jgi:hypothetical protein
MMAKIAASAELAKGLTLDIAKAVFSGRRDLVDLALSNLAAGELQWI